MAQLMDIQQGTVAVCGILTNVYTSGKWKQSFWGGASTHRLVDLEHMRWRMEISVELVNDYMETADLLPHGAGHLEETQPAFSQRRCTMRGFSVLHKEPSAGFCFVFDGSLRCLSSKNTTHLLIRASKMLRCAAFLLFISLPTEKKDVFEMY